MASQINPQQQMLMKIFPYFLPVISFTLPAGIVLYFLVSNLYRIGQQAFITRTMYRDEHGNPIHHGSTDDTSGAKGAEERPKGILASLRQTMAESGPRVGPNANGGKASSKAGGSKTGSKAGAKPSAKSAAKSGATTKGGAKTAGGTAKGGAKTPVKTAKPANRTAQKSGGSKPSGRTTDPEPADPGATAAAPPGRAGSSPSRRPPAPNPNRSRAKKRRR
jgi:hypothetical protein